MIHVCLSLHDKNGTYSKFTGTTILSIFENTNSPVTVHILHDDTLTQDNRENFIYVAGRYSQAVKFYNVAKLCAEKISEMVRLIPFAETSRLSVAALYRLLIPQLLPAEIEKIIYLDSDIIVDTDINELWKIALDGKIFAAVPESSNGIPVKEFVPLCLKGFVKPENYFNSGVMVIDLKIFRGEEKNLMRGVAFTGKFPELVCLDQDVLNYLFSKNYLKLPEKFNAFIKSQRYYKINLTRGKIYHYTAMSLGFGLTLDMNDEFNRLWLKYFVKTPWFNERIIGRLYESFLQTQDELKKSAMKILSAMKNKQRVFIVADSELDTLIKNFSVRQDEEILVIQSGIPTRQLIESMKVFRGQKIFFIMLGGFSFERLINEGFVRGEDFVDCSEFLPNFNSYPLVAAM